MHDLRASLKHVLSPRWILTGMLYALLCSAAYGAVYQNHSHDQSSSPDQTNETDQALDSDDIQYLGMATFDHHLTFEGEAVGGLSGLTYLGQHHYLAISDDRSRFAPARYYRLYIDLHDGKLTQEKVHITQSTHLKRADTKPYAWGQIDPEGIAYHPQKGLYIASEGDNLRALAPSINRYHLNGQWQQALRLPDYFMPNHQQGTRHNNALESLAITPDGNHLLTATEQALVQDGPVGDDSHSSPARLVMIDLNTTRVMHQYLYLTDKQGYGLVDLIALSDQRLITLERNYKPGQHNGIRLYDVQLAQATNINDVVSIKSLSPPPTPAHKSLIIDLKNLGIHPDNIEGMALGPRLSDQWQALILVSDNNFNHTQKTQIIGLAIRTSFLRSP